MEINNQSIPYKLKHHLPKAPPKTYKPVDICIYCGNTNNLSDEHIIPFGFGGRMVLPKSSCKLCTEKTSTFEMTCLRTMYGPLRLMYDLPSRRRKGRPATLPLKIKYKPEDEWTEIPINQEDYPFLVTFPYFSMPDLLTGIKTKGNRGPVTKKLWIRGASANHVFLDHLQKLTLKLKVYSIMPESKAHIEEFCQMLAKIGYSYAIAELGYGKFEPLLLKHIIDRELSNCADFIGSLDKDELPSINLHELSLHQDSNKNYIIVRMRFLAKLGTPTYYVVVGLNCQNNKVSDIV